MYINICFTVFYTQPDENDDVSHRLFGRENGIGRGTRHFYSRYKQLTSDTRYRTQFVKYIQQDKLEVCIVKVLYS